MNPGMYSSATPEWETPQELFDALDREFHFGIDVCATDENAKVETYFTKEQDALCWQHWAFASLGKDPAFMNPPYGRAISKWVDKARATAAAGRTVVCLLPARTDTAWWHDFIWDETHHEPRSGVEVRLLRGRLKFGGSENSAPFPSAVVIFWARQ